MTPEDIAAVREALMALAWDRWTCTSVSDTGSRVCAMIRRDTGEYIDASVLSAEPEALAALVAGITEAVAVREADIARIAEQAALAELVGEEV